MTFNPLNSSLNFAIEHFAIGAAISFGAYVISPQYYLWIIFGFLFIILLKEAFWDPSNETNQPFITSGINDFFWYIMGTVVALLIIHFLVGVL